MNVNGGVLLFAAMVAVGCRDRDAREANVAPRATAAAVALVVGGSALVPSRAVPEGVPLLVLGPFLVNGMPYTVEMERYLNDPDTAVRRIRLRDSTRRVVHEEDLAAMLQGDSTSWIELSVGPLEDAAGRARGLEIQYGFFPSAPNSGDAFMILVPRDGALRPLTPRISYSGNLDPLPSGAQPRSQRLLPGDRAVIKPWMYNYAAVVPVHVDLGCEPGSPSCITLALPDSIAGLARFAVEAEPRAIESAAAVELFPAPGNATPERIQLVAGSRIAVLGGAGRVSFDRSRGMDLVVTEDWLLVRVNDRTGWVHGAATYGALGLPSAG
ncbi:MAG TPA: hypothetical protein VFN38_00070 [Gemmatimonadaceae bacterium]|nr:hypothetical protein [Gemmatimonadaceae bacterium]